MTPKPHTSPSQLETFCQCGERGRRIYLEGERLPPGLAAIRGTAVHKAAAVNFAQKIESHTDLSSPELLEVADASFTAEVAGGVSLSAEEESTGKDKVLGAARDQAVKMAAFHAANQAGDYQPVLVEQPFRIELPGPRDLVGVIDLVDDRGVVTDLKTAGKGKSQADADDSIQLTAYAAGHHVLKGQPPAELRLDTIVGREGKKGLSLSRQVLSTHRTAADFGALAARVNAVNDLIQAGVFLPAPLGAWWCSAKYCGFHRTCRFVNSERTAAGGNDE